MDEIGNSVRVHIETKEKSTIPSQYHQENLEHQKVDKRQVVDDQRDDLPMLQPSSRYYPAYQDGAPREEPDTYKPRVHVSIETEKRGVVTRARRDLAAEYTRNIVVPDRAENNMGVIHDMRVNEDIEDSGKRSKILKIDKRDLYGPIFRLPGLSTRATIRGTKVMSNPIVKLLRAAAGQKTQKILGLNSKAFDIFPGPLPEETSAALNNNLGKVSNEAPNEGQMPVSVDQQIIQNFKPVQARDRQQFISRQESILPHFAERQMYQSTRAFSQPNPMMIPARNSVELPAAYEAQQQQQQQQQQMEPQQEIVQNADFIREKPQFSSFTPFEHNAMNSPYDVRNIQESSMEREQIMRNEAQPAVQQESIFAPSQRRQSLQIPQRFPMFTRHRPVMYERQRFREMGGETREIRQPFLSDNSPSIIEQHTADDAAMMNSNNNNNMLPMPQEVMSAAAGEMNRNAELGAFEELRENRGVEDVQPIVSPQALTRTQEPNQIIAGYSPTTETTEADSANLQSRNELPLSPLLSNRLFNVPQQLASTEVVPEVPVNYGNSHFTQVHQRRYHHFGGQEFYHHVPHFDPGYLTHPVYSTPRQYYHRDHPLPFSYRSPVSSHIPRADANDATDEDDDDFDEKPEVHVHVQTEKSHISKPVKSDSEHHKQTIKS